MVMAVARARNRSLNIRRSATKMAQLSRVIHTRLTEITFTLSGIDLWTMKFVMYGPNFGCASSHSYRSLFPRRKSPAARRRKGVVGSTGKKAPRIPSPRAMNPNIVRNHFIIRHKKRVS